MQGRWGGEVRLNTLDSTITTGERPVWNVAGFASDEMLLGRWRADGGPARGPLDAHPGQLLAAPLGGLVACGGPPAPGRLQHGLQRCPPPALLRRPRHPPGDPRRNPPCTCGATSISAPSACATASSAGLAGSRRGCARSRRRSPTGPTTGSACDPRAWSRRPTEASPSPTATTRRSDAYGGELGLDRGFPRRQTISGLRELRADRTRRATRDVVSVQASMPHGSPRHKVERRRPPRARRAGGRRTLTADAQYFGAPPSHGRRCRLRPPSVCPPLPASAPSVQRRSIPS